MKFRMKKALVRCAGELVPAWVVQARTGLFWRTVWWSAAVEREGASKVLRKYREQFTS